MILLWPEHLFGNLLAARNKKFLTSGKKIRNYKLFNINNKTPAKLKTISHKKEKNCHQKKKKLKLSNLSQAVSIFIEFRVLINRIMNFITLENILMLITSLKK
jgi:hypothetical protein